MYCIYFICSSVSFTVLFCSSRCCAAAAEQWCVVEHGELAAVGTAAQAGHTKGCVWKPAPSLAACNVPAAGKELISYNDSESHCNDSERAAVIKGIRIMLKLNFKDLFQES